MAPVQLPTTWCKKEASCESQTPPIVILIIPVMASLTGFYRVTQSPNFEMYRAVDVVQLVGSGVCFGAAMVGVILMLRGARS
jgi:hypothetical protein